MDEMALGQARSPRLRNRIPWRPAERRLGAYRKAAHSQSSAPSATKPDNAVRSTRTGTISSGVGISGLSPSRILRKMAAR